jgi:hypothetical protein
MRRTTCAIALVLLLGCCLLVVGCESLDSTTTTVGGGGSAPGDTSAGVATTLSSGPAVTRDTGGGTWVTGGSGNSILGKWHNNVTGETLEFFPDGTATGTAGDSMGVAVTYAINMDQITVSALGTILVTQTFSIDGNTLTIIDNETGVSGTLQRVQ